MKKRSLQLAALKEEDGSMLITSCCAIMAVCLMLVLCFNYARDEQLLLEHGRDFLQLRLYAEGAVEEAACQLGEDGLLLEQIRHSHVKVKVFEKNNNGCIIRADAIASGEEIIIAASASRGWEYLQVFARAYFTDDGLKLYEWEY